MPTFFGKLFKGNESNATPEAAPPAMVFDPNTGTIVQASTAQNPPTASVDGNALSGAGPPSNTSNSPSIPITNVRDALFAGEITIDDLERRIERTTAQSGGNNQGSGLKYHHASYIAIELGFYEDRISYQYMDDQPDDKAKQQVRDKWSLLQDNLEGDKGTSVGHLVHELLGDYEFPDDRQRAIPLDEALEFCDRARRVLQALRHADVLFHDFRDATTRMKKEKERTKAARLQSETVRTQNAANMLGAIASSIKTVATTVAELVPAQAPAPAPVQAPAPAPAPAPA